MRTLRFTIALITMLFTLTGHTQNMRLQAPAQVVEGHRFQVGVQLTNVSANPPEAPRLENCTLIFGPATQTMQSTQIVNGQVSSQVTYTYTYTYTADRAGTTTVPEIKVNGSDGRQYTAGPATITILPPDRAPSDPSPGRQPGRQPVRQDDRANDRPQFSDDDMFVRVELNKSSVYEQEPVIATVKVYTRADISMFRVVNQPTFEGFLSEELQVPQQSSIEQYNGRNYTTQVLKRCILYPQQSGNLTITSGKYEVTLVGVVYVSSGFFPVAQRYEQNVTTKSNTAHVTVRPLPSPRPAGFSGAVGNYSASVELTPEALRTNEAATYKYTIRGTGNIKYLRTPELDISAGIDQYTPQTNIDADYADGNISGTYTTIYTLMPQEPGDYTIPGPHFIYFNPRDGEYHTIDLESFPLKVTQGVNVASPATQNVIDKGMKDIRHIKPVDSIVRYPKYIVDSPLYLTFFIFLAVAFIVAALLYKRNMRRRADVQGRRLAGASRTASRRLKAARSAMSQATSDRFYAEINKALFGYLGDKLSIPSSELIRDNIADELSRRGVQPETIQQVITVLDECEMARFTPQHSDTEMAGIYQNALNAIKSLEGTKMTKKL